MSIVALGVAFFSGFGATGHDMKLTGDYYFNDRRLMDIRVISSYGLNNNDIKAIRNAAGVKDVYASFSMDAQVSVNGNTSNMKLHSYDPASQINKPYVEYGALPGRSGECAAEQDYMWRYNLSVGDKIILQSGKSADIRNRLRTNTYKITGVVRLPTYISRERGASPLGRGEVD
jgi:putative ABC transport system permease protein